MESEMITMVGLEECLSSHPYRRFVFDMCNQKDSCGIDARFIFDNIEVLYNPNRIIFSSDHMQSYLRLDLIQSIKAEKQAIGDIFTIACMNKFDISENVEYIVVAQ